MHAHLKNHKPENYDSCFFYVPAQVSSNANFINICTVFMSFTNIVLEISLFKHFITQQQIKANLTLTYTGETDFNI